MNNFLLRTFSIIFLLPFFLYILYVNNYFFLLLLILIFFICIYEVKFLFGKITFVILLFLFIFFIFALIKLRGNDILNFYFLTWVLLIVWLSDIGGYIFGKLIGGAKLSKLSPNKTISGFFGSIFFSQFAFFLNIKYSQNLNFTIQVFFFQLTICIISIGGDLFFSYIKRKYNIKDYSNLIPGHGGLLDRIDGLIFAIIFSYLLKFFYAY